ncbi:MAG: zf-TFIIB domain-containing protein [Anaerohalosphaeraceae bacterium]|nr:zf-TFIIB domain-containing protein [Anaerohalosphaeraceae bacterium]
MTIRKWPITMIGEMNCPVCKNSAMVVLELDEVEVDYCFDCQGIWLDAGELELLLDGSHVANALLKSFRPCTDCSEEKRPCPICLKKMQKISAGSESEPIIIDSCKKAHGLWFDAGELQNVISKGSLDAGNKINKLLSDIFKEQ